MSDPATTPDQAAEFQRRAAEAQRMRLQRELDSFTSRMVGLAASYRTLLLERDAALERIRQLEEALRRTQK